MHKALLGSLLALALFMSTPGVAHHLSVGASDAIGLGPDETPRDPSVRSEVHQRGTSTDCGPSDPILRDAGSFRDAICGKLVYHPGTPFETHAPKDQNLRAPIGAFDVQATQHVGVRGFETCLPWCVHPLTGPAYEDVHALAEAAGLGGDSDAEKDEGWQRYGIEADSPQPSVFLSDQGKLPADGWLFPATDTSFVAFLEDREGDPISHERLVEIIEHGRHPSDVIEGVCGFTPEAHLDLRGSLPGCEIPFRWVAPQAGESQGHAPCQSAAYVCAAITPAWRAEVTCNVGTGTCDASPVQEAEKAAGPEPLPRDPTQKHVSFQRPADSTLQPAVWHFAVAPSPSDCQGSREPGFDLDPEGWAYLAHDLDVYITPDEVWPEGAPTTARSWIVDEVQSLASPFWRQAIQPAWQRAPQEPTTDAIVNGLGDDSHTLSLPREWYPCRAVWPTAETENTLDAWKNVVDAHLERSLIGDRIEGSLELPSGMDGQRTRLGAYTPAGHIGLFADTTDDASYTREPWSAQFDAIEQTGSYPVLWDMRVSPTDSIGDGKGCQIDTGPFASQRLPEAMADAGYGPMTGLVQAIALSEATLWLHRPTGTQITAPWGGVFVLASQSPLHHGVGDYDIVPEMEQRIDTIATAARQAAGLEDEPRYLLNQILREDNEQAPDSDFQPQCGEPTGGFTSTWTLVQACRTPEACLEGASVMQVLFESQAPAEHFTEGQAWAKPFPDGHEDVFEPGVNAWTDVDLLGSQTASLPTEEASH